MSAFETTEIKGQAYKLAKLAPLQGGRLATRVAQQLASALDDVETIKGLVSGNREAVEGATNIIESQPQLLSALAGGVKRIDADALYDCAIECVRGNLFAESKLHDDHAFNDWFSRHPDHLILVLAWALKVNCAGFFGLGARD